MPGKHQLTAFQEAVSWSLMASGRSSGSHQMRLSPGQQGAHSPAGETHYPRDSETSPCPLGRASSKAGLWVPCPQSVCFRRSQVGPEVLHFYQDRRCLLLTGPHLENHGVIRWRAWTTGPCRKHTKDSVANRAGDGGGASSGKRCRCKKSGPGARGLKWAWNPARPQPEGGEPALSWGVGMFFRETLRTYRLGRVDPRC